MATYWENSCSFGLRYVSWYKCLIVILVFSHLGFWSGNLFLIVPFPDLCLLVPFACFSSVLFYSFISEMNLHEFSVSLTRTSKFFIWVSRSITSALITFTDFFDFSTHCIFCFKCSISFKSLKAQGWGGGGVSSGIRRTRLLQTVQERVGTKHTATLTYYTEHSVV